MPERAAKGIFLSFEHYFLAFKRFGRGIFERQRSDQFGKYVACVIACNYHVRMVARLDVFALVNVRVQDGDGFQYDKEGARQSLINFERVKIINYRVFEMRFEQ